MYTNCISHASESIQVRRRRRRRCALFDRVARLTADLVPSPNTHTGSTVDICVYEVSATGPKLLLREAKTSDCVSTALGWSLQADADLWLSP